MCDKAYKITCAVEKKISHCYLAFLKNVHFDVLFNMSLLSLICEIPVGVELYLLRFGLLGAALTCFRLPPSPLAGVPAPSRGDP